MNEENKKLDQEGVGQSMISNLKARPGNRLLAVSILLSALIIAGAVIYSKGLGVQSGKTIVDVASDDASRGTGIIVDSGAAGFNNLINDDEILGDKNAPITIVEFSDYQCPFCKSFFDETEKLIKKDFIDTGKVKLVFRDFPLDSMHLYARKAAEASECARKQGKFWEYHDSLFDKQEQLPKLDFVKLGQDLGLSANGFASCLKSKATADEVEKDYQDGLSLGVSGTPTLFVNGERFVGALPYDTLKAVIEAKM